MRFHMFPTWSDRRMSLATRLPSYADVTCSGKNTNLSCGVSGSTPLRTRLRLNGAYRSCMAVRQFSAIVVSSTVRFSNDGCSPDVWGKHTLVLWSSTDRDLHVSPRLTRVLTRDKSHCWRFKLICSEVTGIYLYHGPGVRVLQFD